MAMPKALVLKPLPEEAKRTIRERCELIEPKEMPLSREQLLIEIADVEGLLTNDVRIDSELLNAAKKLRVVSNQSVGYDNFDVAAMKECGVIGTHTPYVLDDTVADLVFALMLAAARRVPELDAQVKQGRWGEPGCGGEAHYGIDVHHATLGIVGMGRIGEAVARRASLGFGMNVLYSGRSRKPAAEHVYGAQYRTLDELLEQADFVVVIAPYTPETARMIRAEHFARMKPTAVFVNASRGQLVEEGALVEALRSGRIFAAGLDVYETEPVKAGHPLLALPNVVTLPHIGSATAKTRHDMAMTAANNLVGGLLNDRPIHIVSELQHLRKG
ncbi:bifunctional glyoxylate/hydroxypyruvate reductase B [Cohnella sp. CIP 111063]|uniref:2-hydroxyacid dehydrogenase n=1 Tax=unclassified Cohnella TaxID=2636738 RepID=UPI000B8BFB3E|nr:MULTISPECIES: D-glycerate dehydrogenase [unclassified Cohnella]OXS59277.1 bifunctional glyoxylate/hydroxypyruvate reductase B [Cohnella sp. CIP 111063]PRX72297.1 gluconate 2-dehydrogenase [Cohnella sp. SGD-V74]